MVSKWQWLLHQLGRTLWVRASLFAVLAVVTALAAIAVEDLLPEKLPVSITREDVEHILDILATSMLAVTTFSLSVMVSAYSAATSSVTPRAARLLQQDTTTQNVLSTFIGSFLFSLVGIVALSTGYYGEAGRLVLFVVTLAVILLIVVTILRWIEHLTHLGRVSETTDKVEEATLAAIKARIDNPSLGARPWTANDKIPDSARAVYADSVGYVQHLDVEALSDCIGDGDGEIIVASLPGTFVHATCALAWVRGIEGDDKLCAIRKAFTLGRERSFDQDPRFGLSVLAEIASRALSPAVNDPGTAIDVIGRAVRLFSHFPADADSSHSKEIKYPQVWVPVLVIDDLFDDIFRPIARDGAGMFEVQMRLQKALVALSGCGREEFRTNARRHSSMALQHGEQALTLEEEKQPLRALAL